MKTTLKLLSLAIILAVVYIIYILFSPNPDKLNYVALGDSIAEGMNSYNAIDYGYADYISDHLKNQKKLGTYTKSFSKSGYTTENLTNDINNNKSIVDPKTNKTINIKEALRESHLVTISIGANDLIKGSSIQTFANKIENIIETKEEIDQIAIKVEELLILVKQYAKNQVILIGYYNPLPLITNYKSQINEIVVYANEKYSEIAKKLEIDYVDVFDVFNSNPTFLPNPSNIHPNTKGYEAISKEIIKKIAN